MFQAWLVKIAKMAASSAPMVLPGKRLRKKVTVKERKPRIGTDCRISSRATRILSARLLLAARGAKVKGKTGEANWAFIDRGQRLRNAVIAFRDCRQDRKNRGERNQVPLVRQGPPPGGSNGIEHGRIPAGA